MSVAPPPPGMVLRPLDLEVIMNKKRVKVHLKADPTLEDLMEAIRLAEGLDVEKQVLLYDVGTDCHKIRAHNVDGSSNLYKPLTEWNIDRHWTSNSGA